MKIVFTDTMGVDDAYAPTPSNKFVPDWFKNMPEYVNGKREFVDGNTPHTVKKCIPVFDAMTAGYMLKTCVDVQVTHRDGLPWYEWPSQSAISFHPIEQGFGHPAANGAPYPKWTNPWAIRTPKGYSSLFVSPMHNPNGIFSILPGIVDTDVYTAPVNFPFVLNDVDWEGVIPAGTVMAQVIPIKRDAWKMLHGDQLEREAQAKVTTRLRSLFFNSYKKQFWSRKEYR